MDFEFSNAFGLPIAKFSMGHEALGRWLSDECSTVQKSDALMRHLTAIDNGERWHFEQTGQALTLNIDHNEVSVSPNDDERYTTEYDSDEDANPFALYQEENQAHCALLDFKAALSSWQNFLKNTD